MFTLKEIAKEVAERKGLSVSLVEKILKSEFKLVRNKVSDNSFSTVMLKYVGKFTPNGKKEYLNKKYGELKGDISGLEERSP